MDDAVLHEPSHRRPEWSESRGEWIKLGDGQSWLFPKPVVGLRPIVAKGRYQGTRITSDIGPEFDASLAAANAALETDDGIDDGTLMQLCVSMLAYFYDLPDDAYGELLDSRRIESNGEPTYVMVWKVASGQAPKPSPAGDD